MKSGQPRLFSLMWISVLMLFSACSLTAPTADSESVSSLPEGGLAVQILSPLPDQTFQAGTTVIIQARVENNGAALTRVSVRLDDALVGEEALDADSGGASAVQLSLEWPTSNPGQYEIAVVAERADGTTAREAVSVSVVSSGDGASTASEALSTALPTPTAAPPVLDGMTAAAANLREGPGPEFALVARIDADQPVEITASNAARDWYKIRYESGEAWIYAESVNASGDVSALPLDNPVSLTVDDIAIVPHPLVCQEAAQIEVTIKNEGRADLPGGGWINVDAVLKSSDEVLESTQAVFPGLAVGGAYTVSASLTVNLHYNETQRIRISLTTMFGAASEDGGVFYGEEYVLQQGGCP